MNPNLGYAEMVLGKNNGSSTGIIDGHNLPNVIDAIGLIQHSPFWTKPDQYVWKKRSQIDNLVV
jgi:hypothetical protein